MGRFGGRLNVIFSWISESVSAAVFSFPAIPLRDGPGWSTGPLTDQRSLVVGQPQTPAGPFLLNRYYADQSNPLLQLWCSESVTRRGTTAEIPGVRWPLVLYGPSGVGKTTLAELLVRRLPGRWLRTSGTEFAREFRKACATRSLAQFHEHLVAYDTLLVDDLTLPANHSALAREWTQLLDQFNQRQRPVLVTMLTAPFADHALPQPLRSRLSAGLSISVQPPGRAARSRLVEQLLERLDLNIDPPDLEWLVDTLPRSVPLICRALSRLAIDNAGCPTHIPRRRLENLLQHVRPEMDPRHFAILLKMVARHFRLRVSDLTGPGRQRPLVRARSVVAWLARVEFSAGFSRIGQLLGQRDASTIRHACRVIAAQRGTDPALGEALDLLRQKLEKRLAP